ncbi:MAG: PEGA domain-containing protein [Treponema sp.]|nr:PEGA domain-containing protein [Treponema sp.]
MKKSGYFFVACLITFVLMLSGCATIISGSTQDLTFESNPEGAKIYLDGKLMGVTPFTVSLHRNKYKKIRVEKEGYETFERDLNKKFNCVSLLNVLLGGFLGSTTDGVSGAMFNYEDNSYFIELTKKE